jgi:hypothetical protein
MLYYMLCLPLSAPLSLYQPCTKPVKSLKTWKNPINRSNISKTTLHPKVVATNEGKWSTDPRPDTSDATLPENVLQYDRHTGHWYALLFFSQRMCQGSITQP